MFKVGGEEVGGSWITLTTARSLEPRSNVLQWFSISTAVTRFASEHEYTTNEQTHL